MKICIIKMSSIGDISHTAFLPQLIKQTFPNSHISWVCDENFTGLLTSNTFIDKIHPICSKKFAKKTITFLKTAFKIKKEKFDFVLDLQGTFKSAITGRIISKNVYGFHQTRDIVANKLYKNKLYCSLNSNVYHRNILAINQVFKLNLSVEKIPLPYILPTQNIQKKEKSVLIFPSSSKNIKNLSVENYQALIVKLQKTFNVTLIFGSQQEEQTCKEISQSIQNINIIGNIPLSEIKNELPKYECIIGSDTGLLHIASAMKIPNVTLYGPTPKYRTSINKPHSISLQGNGSVNKIPLNEIEKSIKFLTKHE